MKNFKILLVDDEPSNISILMGIFGSDYEMYVATDGKSALEIATSQNRPDLILLDISMPEMDGFEVAYHLKHTKYTSTIPFIFLTAKDDEESMIRGFNEGAVDYLTKPFRKEELLVRVKNHLLKQKLQNSLSEAMNNLQEKMKELDQAEQEFETIFNQSQNGIALTDLETNFLLVNNSYSRITGFTKEELLTRSCVELTDIDDVEKSQEAIRTVMSNGYVENLEKKCIANNKSPNVNISISMMPDKQRLLLNTSDVTKLKIAEKKIAQYAHIMDKNIISSSTDLDGNIIEVSEAFCKLTGYSREEFLGENHNMLKDIDTPESTYKQMWDTITQDITWSGEVKNLKKDGSLYWVNATIFPIFNDDNIKTGYMAIRQDITDKKRIEELSITDALTKLYNRRYFNEVLEKELRRVQRDATSITFLMLDVDHFKLYNDTYGHQEGDIVLAKIGTVLSEFANRAGDYAFRLGGEEFGLLYHSEDLQKAEEYALHLADTITNLQIPHANNSASSFVTVSIGVVFKDSQNSLTSNEMYKIADDCLYLAKENGRNQIQIYKYDN